LPTIPIPLSNPNPDVVLDLAALFAETYDDAPYSELIDYMAPLDLPLAADDRDWVEAQVRNGLRKPDSKMPG
jgi:hypothetical protein